MPSTDLLPPTARDIPAGVFADGYAQARDRFLAGARAAGAALAHYPHPLAGPGGEALATDTAWLGPADAPRVLVTGSALHGVEGFAGSAAQADSLAHLRASSLPPGTAVLHVHAINPWGFAWLRRVNEEGVDLNRNAVDFSQPLPANTGYDQLADALVPADDDPCTLAAAQARLDAFREAHGREAFEVAVTGGQYRHPGGLFYGGRGPTWSLRTLEAIIDRHGLERRELAAIVDVHTGLGPFGYGEVICDHPPASRGAALARAWFGPSVTEPALGTSTSVPKQGLVDYYWHARLPDRCCFVTLEFGTWPLERMFPLLRDDHRLHGQGVVDWTDPAVQRVKQALRAHFSPDRGDWQESVLFRARQVFLQALRGLASA